MTQIPTTVEEFSRLHGTCFGCGANLLSGPEAMRATQITDLARLGIEHALCSGCGYFLGGSKEGSALLVAIVERCVVLAIAAERYPTMETNNHGPMFEKAMKEANMNDEPEVPPNAILVIEDLFTYHPPTGDQANRYLAIREAAKKLAYVIDECCEPGPDRTAAIRHLRECVMTANASIATNNAQYR